MELSLIAHFRNSKGKLLRKVVAQQAAQVCLVQAVAEGLALTAEIYGFATRKATMDF